MIYTIFYSSDQFIQNAIFMLAFLIGFVGLAVRYYLSEKDPHELYDLIRNELRPNKTKQLLGLRTEILLIEHKNDQTVFEKFKRHFRNQEDIKFSHFVADFSDTQLQESVLINCLARVDSVVFVRTKNLEKTPWVYEIVQRWAMENSNIPCLVVDKIYPEELSQLITHPIPQNFYFIPDDPKVLPWALLKRANQRTAAWRKLAKINRSITRNIAILVLVVTAALIVNYFIDRAKLFEYKASLQLSRADTEESIGNSHRNNFTALQEIYKEVAGQTKRQFEALFPNSNVTVAHWIRFGDKMFQISSSNTEKRIDQYYKTFLSTEWAIGCALLNENHHVIGWPPKAGSRSEKNIAGTVKVISISDRTRLVNHGCIFKPQKTREISSILCTSFNQTDDKEITVGVCIDTPTQLNFLDERALQFANERAHEFYTAISPSLQKKSILPFEVGVR